jgi:peptidoglycan/LPS O-acetylase OafA/YrhL
LINKRVFHFFKVDTLENRVFGLDLIRFLAIIYVVLGHSKILVPEKYDFIIGKLILDGVSIFFVLSGFLIGRILINQITLNKTKISDIITFWKRRWIRTLPAYIFTLTFVIIFTFLLKPNRLPLDFYKYYLFIQNFNTPHPPFFSEAWSLSIEEWFYIFTPIVFVISFRFRKKINTLLFSIILSVISVIFYRIHLFYTIDISNYEAIDENILSQVVPRLDAIMFGVLAAYLSLQYKRFWNFLNKSFLAFIGFASLYFMKQFNSTFDSMYVIVFLPALKSIAVVLMLPYLSNLRLKKTNFISKFIVFTSIISYSIYLLNRTVVIDIIIKYGINDNLIKKHSFDEYWIWEYLLFWLLTFGLSFIMYKFIEKPFMKLRKTD